MSYTNSSLVNYTRISPKKNSPRNHKIDTITIHCLVAQWTSKQACDYFATTTRSCSVNYVVGKDGSIGLCVDEKDRSWCTSSASNDHRAVTIEVASDMTHPYAVTDAAYNALIKLVADICKRNDIKELKWQGDKSLIGQIDKQNMTVHRWFANKSCPGDYLYQRHGDIANKVNAILNPPVVTVKPSEVKKSNEEIANEVIAGKWGNGETRKQKLNAAGYDYNAVQSIVNAKLSGKTTTTTSKPVQTTKPAQPTKKSNEEIAKEVIRGKWGNGSERKKRLAAAGYDYAAIQKIVNRMLK